MTPEHHLVTRLYKCAAKLHLYCATRPQDQALDPAALHRAIQDLKKLISELEAIDHTT